MATKSKEMDVTVRMLDGTSYAVSVNYNDNVLRLKNELFTLTQVPVNTQRLVYCGKELRDDDCVGDCDIGRDTCIHLVEIKPEIANGTAGETVAEATTQLFDLDMPQLHVTDKEWTTDESKETSGTKVENLPFPTAEAQEYIAEGRKYAEAVGWKQRIVPTVNLPCYYHPDDPTNVLFSLPDVKEQVQQQDQQMAMEERRKRFGVFFGDVEAFLQKHEHLTLIKLTQMARQYKDTAAQHDKNAQDHLKEAKKLRDVVRELTFQARNAASKGNFNVAQEAKEEADARQADALQRDMDHFRENELAAKAIAELGKLEELAHEAKAWLQKQVSEVKAIRKHRDTLITMDQFRDAQRMEECATALEQQLQPRLRTMGLVVWAPQTAEQDTCNKEDDPLSYILQTSEENRDEKAAKCDKATRELQALRKEVSTLRVDLIKERAAHSKALSEMSSLKHLSKQQKRTRFIKDNTRPRKLSKADFEKVAAALNASRNPKKTLQSMHVVPMDVVFYRSIGIGHGVGVITGNRVYGFTKGNTYLDGKREQDSAQETIFDFVVRNNLACRSALSLWIDGLMDPNSVEGREHRFLNAIKAGL